MREDTTATDDLVRRAGVKGNGAMWSTGALLPALGASLGWICCLPILGGAIGAITGAVGSTLLPWRPYLSAISILALGIGFWQAYRPVRPCGEGASCQPASRRRQRIMLWCVTGVVGGLLTIQLWSSWVIYWTL